jgi:hypothetical protein
MFPRLNQPLYLRVLARPPAPPPALSLSLHGLSPSRPTAPAASMSPTPNISDLIDAEGNLEPVPPDRVLPFKAKPSMQVGRGKFNFSPGPRTQHPATDISI